MNQPLIDLKAQYKTLKWEIDEAIQKVLIRTDFILGEEVSLFEQEFASYIGTKYAVGVASGTDALVIALESAGIGHGDEVITTPMTFFATTEAILRVGATPVFVDIDETGNMDFSQIRITPKTKAILPVHLLGNPLDIENLKKFNLPIIQDCAQACGGYQQNGARVGSDSLASCFSFFPGKNLGCYGDGGMIVTNDKDIYDKSSVLRKHGAKERYVHYYVGYNSRLDTIQAAILRVKLKHLDAWNERRREIALKYTINLQNKYRMIKESGYNVYNYYCFYAPNRDELIKKLEANGIAAGIYFPTPMHLLPVMKTWCDSKGFARYKTGDFPNAERHAKEVIALPMYAEMTNVQVDSIVEVLR